jgi:hypothetical protein
MQTPSRASHPTRQTWWSSFSAKDRSPGNHDPQPEHEARWNLRNKAGLGTARSGRLGATIGGFVRPQVVHSIRIAGSTPHFLRGAAFDHIAADRYFAFSRERTRMSGTVLTPRRGRGSERGVHR